MFRYTLTSVVGQFSWNNLENILRLLRFGMYFEIILNRKWLFSCGNNDTID